MPPFWLSGRTIPDSEFFFNPFFANPRPEIQKAEHIGPLVPPAVGRGLQDDSISKFHFRVVPRKTFDRDN